MSAYLLNNKSIAVLCGGSSVERDISLKSGAYVVTALEEMGAIVTRIDPAEDSWVEQLHGIEFVFNLLHGPGGEDGVLAGFLTCMKLPYSGSGVLSSALAMDKIRTKLLWQGRGLPTPKFVLLYEDSDWQGLIETYKVLVVKPALEGSSVGMTKVCTAEELKTAFEKARAFGDDVFAEALVDGEEFTVAILGNRALPSIRIKPATGFYDFDAKYVSDDTQFYCPAGLSDADEKALADLALNAFDAVGCSVWGRVDVIRAADGDWQLLEVNIIPGMTSHSLVPMAAHAAGLSMSELLVEIYRLSLDARHVVE